MVQVCWACFLIFIKVQYVSVQFIEQIPYAILYLYNYVLYILFFQILIATSTLAWGVNFPAHLVIVKGTEYFDGKTRRYVDFPVTGKCNI